MNIIVVIADTFRHDHIGANGAPWMHTPDLDRFAERAAVFDRAYLSSFPTIPHRTDCFTGRCSYPFHPWRPLDRSVPVMSSILAQAGFVSQLLCDTPHLMAGAAGFDRGFTAAYWIRGQEGDVPFTRFNEPLREFVPPEKTRLEPKRFGAVLANVHRWTNAHWRRAEDRFAARTADLACRWLEENHRTRGFLLWIDFFDPHEPWDPPEFYVRRYDPDYRGIPMFHPNYGPADAYSGEELRNLRAHYAGEASFVSRCVGRVFDRIDDLGLFDDTLVVFTSDHGIFLGEHNRTGKSNIHPADERTWPLYDVVSHVPLMVSAPGCAPGRRNELVQPVDLLPTVLDYAGVAPAGLDLHGWSMRPLIEARPTEWPRRTTVSASFLGQVGPRSVTPSVVRDRHALVLNGPGGRAGLYDLASDPGQERDLAGERPGVVDEMLAAARDELRRIGSPGEHLALFEP